MGLCVLCNHFPITKRRYSVVVFSVYARLVDMLSGSSAIVLLVPLFTFLDPVTSCGSCRENVATEEPQPEVCLSRTPAIFSSVA